MSYDEWEKAQQLSPSSPEGYWAERAWNAALEQALKEVNWIVPSSQSGLRARLKNAIAVFITKLN